MFRVRLSLVSLIDLAGGTMAAATPPTPRQRYLLARFERQTEELATRVNALFDEDVAALDKLMLDNGIGRVDAGKKVEQANAASRVVG